MYFNIVCLIVSEQSSLQNVGKTDSNFEHNFYFLNYLGGAKNAGDSSKFESLPSADQLNTQSSLEKLNTCLKGSPFLAGPDATQVLPFFSSLPGE